MRGFDRASPIVILAVALAGVTCAFPTDKSDKVFVTLQAPTHVVLRGQEVSIYAQAWRVIGADTQAITNVDFAFTSAGGTVARVDKGCCGYATVTGVNSGTVDIIARAVSFAHAQDADLPLRVANALEIDSVRPSLVRLGQRLTVYGVGVDSLFIASLAGVNLIEYPFSRLRDSATGLGQISFWVPLPARSDPLFYLGAGVFGFAAESTHVKFEDLFEPNDTVPTNLSLDVPGPWPGTALAPVIFTNPALAFEPVNRSRSGEDWYRLSTGNANQPLTFFINYPSVGGDTSGTRIFLLDSLYYQANGDPTKDPIEKFVGRDSADFIGSAFYRCKGFVFGPHQAARESTTIALKSLPSSALHILTNWTRPARYGLTVLRGYYTADPRIGPDAYEENDMCTYADSGNRRIAIAAPFSDTLTIDNPHDIDWLRIDVPGTGPVTMRLQTKSRPFVVTAADTSDIDVYVLTVPNQSLATGLTLVALDTARGSATNVVAPLTGGSSYYVAVVDFAGIPMRYSLCMAVGASVCTLIPSAPFSSSSIAPVVSAPRRRAGSRSGPIVESPQPGDRGLFPRTPRRP
jgi:hypothetical protein